MRDFSFPMALDQIPKFEVMNNLCINVHGLEDENQEKINAYDNHKMDCQNINKTHRIILPKEHEKILLFSDHKYKESVPFAVCADLECILESNVDRSQKHIYITLHI
ncbi:hypothetical protein PV326_011454, partial [Microctonus aethiopoides]